MTTTTIDMTKIREAKATMEKDMRGNLPAIRDLAQTILHAQTLTINTTEADELKKMLKEVFSFYAQQSKAICYNAAAESGNPMLYAIRVGSYEVLKIKKDDDEESIVEGSKDIDLLDLYKKQRGIGEDVQWKYFAEKFNYRFTARLAENIGDTATAEKLKEESNFKASDAAWGFKIPFPTATQDMSMSNNHLKKALTIVLTMMVGEKVEDHAIVAGRHDVAFVLNSITKLKKGKIEVASHKDFALILKYVLKHIIYGMPYEIASKNIKTEA